MFPAVGSGRRFDPGGGRGREEEGEGCFPLPLLNTTTASSSSSSSSSLSGVDEVDSSSVSGSSHPAASASPSDTEEGGGGEGAGTKMSRRQRKNKNKTKPKTKKVKGEHSSGSSVVQGSTRALFDQLGKSESEVYSLVLPLCCGVEDRVLNGYPFHGAGGTHLFRASGYTTLATVLAGAGALAMLRVEGGESSPGCDGDDNTSDYSEPDSLLDHTTSDCCPDDNDSQDTSSGVSSDSKEGEGEAREWCGCGAAGVEAAVRRVEKCERCRQAFSLGDNGRRVCQYHPRRVGMRQDGQLRYQCCHKLKGVAGCTTAPMHVYHNLRRGLNGPLEGFVVPGPGPAGVVGLDCEMVYTAEGFEVARVTVVGVRGRVMVDTYVRPKGQVFDYNTQFSGITAAHMASALTLGEARDRVLRHVMASTVVVGHSLEGDLAVLGLRHDKVVDTALLFKAPPPLPHTTTTTTHTPPPPPPPPHKQSLKSLAKKHLGRDIQCGGGGHDSVEDATVVLDLLLNHLIESHKGFKVAPLPHALKYM